jgi:2,3-bisphosphoglycerate-independent phosphoglycerate mutase
VFDGLTPLEAADTPNLNALAGAGQWGRVVVVPEGQQAHTHLGVGLLFGMDESKLELLARGPIEAAGLGWVLEPSDVAIRVNFATLERTGDGYLVLDRRAGRIDQGARELGQSLRRIDLGEGVLADFHSSEQHRGVLRLTGPGLSAQVSDTDPGNVPMPARLRECLPLVEGTEAMNTAGLLNRFTGLAHEILRAHPINEARLQAGLPPANGIVGRGAGSLPAGLLSTTHNGIGTVVVAGCSTVLGLARMFGFKVVQDDRFSADVNTDLDAKVEAAIEALSLQDLVYLHVKAPDICAHDQEPVTKSAFLERVDQAIAPLLSQDLVIGVVADHGTDSNTGWHIDDPVPALLSETRRVDQGPTVNFGESSCATGPMGQISGREFVARACAAIGLPRRAEDSPESLSGS